MCYQSDRIKHTLGLEGAARKAWARARRDEWEQGRLATGLQGPDRAGAACAEATPGADSIRRNRARRLSAAFRADGLCVGPEGVEAGGQPVVGARLQPAGVPWTTAGANASLAWRACVLSNRSEASWERQARPAPGPPGRPGCLKSIYSFQAAVRFALCFPSVFHPGQTIKLMSYPLWPHAGGRNRYPCGIS